LSCVSKLRKGAAKEALDGHCHRPLLDMPGYVGCGRRARAAHFAYETAPATQRRGWGFIYAVLGVAYTVLLGLVVAWPCGKNGTRPPRRLRSSGLLTGYSNPRTVTFGNSPAHTLGL